MLMEIQQIMDILGKIESVDGKVRFLEKCLFEEKSSAETRTKVLELLHKFTKKRVSFEERIRQQEKEKIESVVEEVAPPVGRKKESKEPAKQKRAARLESAVENPLRGTEEPLVETTATKDYLAGEPAKEPKKEGAEEGYRPKSAEEQTYMRPNARTIEESRYLPRIALPKPALEQEHVSEEEYKRRELFKVGREEETKKEEYRKKLIRGG
jgi:hypothetical protein